MPQLHQTCCPQELKNVIEEWLSPREREHYRRFRSLRRRRSWLAGRLAAKALLQERLASEGRRLQAAEIEIATNFSGEPSVVIRGEPLRISLSIAHCGDRGLAGVAEPEEGRIGVDLERVRPVHPRLAERLLHPGDREVLAKLDPQGGEMSRLILAWALKEAAFKALRPFLPEGAPLSLWDLRLQDLPEALPSGARALLIYSRGGWETQLEAAAEHIEGMWVAWALLPRSAQDYDLPHSA